MSSRKGRKKQAEAEATEQKGRKGFTDGGKGGGTRVYLHVLVQLSLTC